MSNPIARRVAAIVLSIMVLFAANFADAQRTGGSFGGSSWGNSRSSTTSSTSPSFRSSPSPVRSSYRDAPAARPTPRTYSPTFNTVSGARARQTTGVAVTSNTNSDADDNDDSSDGVSEFNIGYLENGEPWGSAEWLCFIIFMGVALGGVVAVITLHNRHARRGW